jgi:hypothetical protein
MKELSLEKGYTAIRCYGLTAVGVLNVLASVERSPEPQSRWNHEDAKSAKIVAKKNSKYFRCVFFALLASLRFLYICRQQNQSINGKNPPPGAGGQIRN